MDEEPSKDLAEDDTGLALVVRDKTSVLDELWQVDVGDIKVSNLGLKLQPEFR